MQGFRILNPNLAPLANPTVDPGFRDDTSIPLFDPILEGMQNKNFTKLKLPKYVSYEEQLAKEKAAAAKKKAKQNQGGGDGYSGSGSYQIGNTNKFSKDVAPSGWGDSDSASDNAADDAMGDSDIGGGGYDSGWDNSDEGFAKGGTIPPMYAYDGLTKQERDRMAMQGQEIDIGGTIDKANDMIFKALNPTYGNLISQGIKAGTQALTKSTPAGYVTGLIANDLMKGMSNQQIADKLFEDKQLYDAIYDFTDYDANPSQNDFISEGQSKDYGVNVGTIPNIDMTDPANYNIKDYVGIPEDPENYGAIFGDYSNPYTSGISAYDPAGINSWKDLENTIKSGLQNNYDYGLTAEDTSYNEKVSQALADELSNPPTSGGSSSSSSSSSGGDNDGGMGFDASDAASGADDAMGDGSGSFSANDDDDGGDYDPSFNRGGYVYASKGGYVNSTGGK